MAQWVLSKLGRMGRADAGSLGRADARWLTVSTGPHEQSAPSEHHELLQQLRDWPDQALDQLVQRRPDLLDPVPASLGWLARIALTPASTKLALEQLSLPTLQVATALALLPLPAHWDDLCAALAIPATPEPAQPGQPQCSQLDEHLHLLRERGLVWGPSDRLHLASAAREIVAQLHLAAPPAAHLLEGLATASLTRLLDNLNLPHPPNRAAQLRLLGNRYDQRSSLRCAVASLPLAVRRLLHQLCQDPNATVPTSALGAIPTRLQAGEPGLLLQAMGLALPTSAGFAQVPLQVRLALTGAVFPAWSAQPPHHQPEQSQQPALVDRSAAALAWQWLHTAEQIATLAAATPLTGVRSGALGTRELRRLLTELATTTAAGTAGDEQENLLVTHLEILVQAGIFARTPAQTSQPVQWVPAPYLHDWQHQEAGRRWAVLAWAWLHLRREPGLGTPAQVLGPQPEGLGALQLRRDTLLLLAEGCPANDAQQLAAALHWRWPMRYPPHPDPHLHAVLQQGQQLGILVGCQLGTIGQQLSQAAYAPSSEGSSAPQPEHDDHQNQPDQEGSVLHRLARQHHDQATRRQEQAVHTAAALLTPLLPPLHDQVIIQGDLTAVATGRLSSASAAMLGQLATVESSGGATVYRFTSTRIEHALRGGLTAKQVHAFLAEVSSTCVPQPLTYLVDDLARLLRRDNDSATPTPAEGTQASPAPPRRARPPAQSLPAATAAVQPLSPAAREALIAAWRAEQAEHTTPGPASTPAPPTPVTAQDPPPLHHYAAGPLLRLLRASVETAAPVWVGYVNADGVASTHLIQPIRVHGGTLHGYDRGLGGHQQRRLSIHRITGVAPQTAMPSST